MAITRQYQETIALQSLEQLRQEKEYWRQGHRRFYRYPWGRQILEWRRRNQPQHDSAFGVFGSNTAGCTGIAGVSTGSGIGVYGKSKSRRRYGRCGWHWRHRSKLRPGWASTARVKARSVAQALWARRSAMVQVLTARVAGWRVISRAMFEVTGDIRLTDADCAEDFNIGLDVLIEPGTVMVLGKKTHFIPVSMPTTNVWQAWFPVLAFTSRALCWISKRSGRNRQPIAC